MDTTAAEFLKVLERSNLFSKEDLEQIADWGAVEGKEVAQRLIDEGRLTDWQGQQLLSGSTNFFLGGYKLLDKLGEGGMGAVYRGEHTPTGRSVAIKVMSQNVLGQPEAVSRFLREVRSLSALSHPNFVAALDANDENGIYYLVMEHVAGKDLKAWLKQYGKLPINWACECMRQAALALEHAHSCGLVHRDIKPSNILVLAEDLSVVPQIKILDMGLSTFTADAQQTHLTKTGQCLGTIDYMAPEQARDTKNVDIRADIFSLGASLCTLHTGRVPYQGNNPMEKLMARATKESPRASSLLPDLPVELDDLLASMLARQPDNRPSTPAVVAQALIPFAMSDSHLSDESHLLSDPTILDRPGSTVEAVADHTLGDFLASMADGNEPCSLDTANTDFASVGVETGAQKKWLTGLPRRIFPASVGGVAIAVAVLLYIMLGHDISNEPQSVAKVESLPNKARPGTQPLGIALAPSDEAWIKRVQALSADAQVAEVSKKLKDLNPGFDGNVDMKIEAGAVTKFGFFTNHVSQIWPVRVFSQLTDLRVNGKGHGQGRLTHLESLVGMKLVRLNVNDNPNLTSLEPLRGLNLQALDCWWTGVSNLSPLEGLPLKLLNCNTTKVTSIEPLRGMKLHYLHISGCDVSDLTPLFGMPLSYLSCANPNVTTLEPLRGMKLDYLNCGSSKITSLDPIKGMNLNSLVCSSTSISDLTPVIGQPITNIQCQNTKISSLEPLREMKLTTLDCRGTGVWDFTPLAGMPLKSLGCDFNVWRDRESLKSLKFVESINDEPVAQFWKSVDAEYTAFDIFAVEVSMLAPEEQVLAVGRKLVELNPGFDGKVVSKIEGKKVVELNFSTEMVQFIWPVRTFPALTSLRVNGSTTKKSPLIDLRPLAGMPLIRLSCGFTKVNDLSPLRGMRLEFLSCVATEVSDLEPLRGMPLRELHAFDTRIKSLSPLAGTPLLMLNCHGTQIRDLTPLSECPITWLDCMHTQVSDLSPLTGKRITFLEILDTKVVDLSPLKGMPLKTLRLDFKPAFEPVLRTMTSLQIINDKRVDEFWKNVPEKK